MIQERNEFWTQGLYPVFGSNKKFEWRDHMKHDNTDQALIMVKRLNGYIEKKFENLAREYRVVRRQITEVIIDATEDHHV